MLHTVPVKIIVVTWEVYFCGYTVFEEALQKVNSNECCTVQCRFVKRFVLLAICGFKIQVLEVVYLNISRLWCFTT